MALSIQTLKQLCFPDLSPILISSHDLILNGDTYMVRWSWRMVRGLAKVLLSSDELQELKSNGGILKPAHCKGLTELVELRNEKDHSDFAKSLQRN